MTDGALCFAVSLPTAQLRQAGTADKRRRKKGVQGCATSLNFKIFVSVPWMDSKDYFPTEEKSEAVLLFAKKKSELDYNNYFSK